MFFTMTNKLNALTLLHNAYLSTILSIPIKNEISVGLAARR